MIVTEDEAKTKRCQEAYAACDNVAAAEYIDYYASQPSGAPFYCIGSQCMAWRWFDTANLGYCGKIGKR